MNERALVWSFVRAIFKDWVGWMSGGLGLLLTIGAQFMANLASPGWFWAVGIFALLFSCYRAWRQEKMRLQPRLKLHTEIEESRTGHFRVVLENTSEGETVSGCAVVLDNPNPIIDHWPFALHCSGQPPVPHYETIDLHPGQPRKFDICHYDGQRVLLSCATRDDIMLPPQSTYRFTLRASGRGIPSDSKEYYLDWAGPRSAPKITCAASPLPATQS